MYTIFYYTCDFVEKVLTACDSLFYSIAHVYVCVQHCTTALYSYMKYFILIASLPCLYCAFCTSVIAHDVSEVCLIVCF